MNQARYSPELKMAASEYGSDVGYLVREFEIEAERKSVEKKNASVKAKEDAVGSKKRFMARIFEKHRAPR